MNQTYLGLPGEKSIGDGWYPEFPLPVQINDVSDITEITIGNDGYDDFRFTAVDLVVDGVVAYSRTYASPVVVSRGGYLSHTVATAEELRVNPLWTQLYRPLGEPNGWSTYSPRSKGLTKQQFIDTINAFVISSLVVNPDAKSEGSHLLNQTRTEAWSSTWDGIISVYMTVQARDKYPEANCRISFNLALSGLDDNGGPVPHYDNSGIGGGMGKIAVTRLTLAGAPSVQCDTGVLPKVFSFMVQGVVSPFLAPTDYNVTSILETLEDAIVKGLAGSAPNLAYNRAPPPLYFCFPNAGIDNAVDQSVDWKGGITLCSP
jgi:hypothetical protein